MYYRQPVTPQLQRSRHHFSHRDRAVPRFGAQPSSQWAPQQSSTYREDESENAEGPSVHSSSSRYHYLSHDDNIVCRCNRFEHEGNARVDDPSIREQCIEFFYLNKAKVTCTRREWLAFGTEPGQPPNNSRQGEYLHDRRWDASIARRTSTENYSTSIRDPAGEPPTEGSHSSQPSFKSAENPRSPPRSSPQPKPSRPPPHSPSKTIGRPPITDSLHRSETSPEIDDGDADVITEAVALQLVLDVLPNISVDHALALILSRTTEQTRTETLIGEIINELLDGESPPKEEIAAEHLPEIRITEPNQVVNTGSPSGEVIAPARLSVTPTRKLTEQNVEENPSPSYNPWKSINGSPASQAAAPSTPAPASPPLPSLEALADHLAVMVTTPSFDPWRESPSINSNRSSTPSTRGSLLDPRRATPWASSQPRLFRADLTRTRPPQPQFNRSTPSSRPLSPRVEAPRANITVDSDPFVDAPLQSAAARSSAENDRGTRSTGTQTNLPKTPEQLRKTPQAINGDDVNDTFELRKRRERSNVRDESPCAQVSTRRSRTHADIESYYDYIVPDDNTSNDDISSGTDGRTASSRFPTRSRESMRESRIPSASGRRGVVPTTPDRRPVRFESPDVSPVRMSAGSADLGTPPVRRRPPVLSPEEEGYVSDEYSACER
ncbi:RBR-type E3 ubiquitin transferase [Ascochyta lentis]